MKITRHIEGTNITIGDGPLTTIDISDPESVALTMQATSDNLVVDFPITELRELIKIFLQLEYSA